MAAKKSTLPPVNKRLEVKDNDPLHASSINDSSNNNAALLSTSELEERLFEYEEAGWITNEEYRMYNKLLQETDGTSEASLYREQIVRDLQRIISKNAIIVQPTYVLHSPPTISTSISSSSYRRSSTGDVRYNGSTKKSTTSHGQNSRQQQQQQQEHEIIMLDDIDDSASQSTRRNSTGSTVGPYNHLTNRSTITVRNQNKNSVNNYSNNNSKLQSILLLRNQNTANSLDNRSSSHHHVTWSDDSSNTMNGENNKATFPTDDGYNNEQRLNGISDSLISSAAKTPIRSNMRTTGTNTTMSNYSTKIMDSLPATSSSASNIPLVVSASSSASVSTAATHGSIAERTMQSVSTDSTTITATPIIPILELSDLWDHQERLVTGGGQQQDPTTEQKDLLYRCFQDIKLVRQLFVEMCFFARLGFVQPPCCLQCTYKESILEKHFRSQQNISADAGSGLLVPPNRSCQRWVAWRKDASTNTTGSSSTPTTTGDRTTGGSRSSASSLTSSASPQSATTMLRPDTLEGNLIFIRCYAVRSLLDGEMVDGRLWDKSAKRLIDTRQQTGNVGCSGTSSGGVANQRNLVVTTRLRPTGSTVVYSKPIILVL